MAASRLCNGRPLCWRSSAVTMVPRVVGGVPPYLGSPALLAASRLTWVASRLYNDPTRCWRFPAFTVVARFDGGLPPLQLSSVVLAAFRRYNGSPRCWRRPALPGVTRVVGGVPPYLEKTPSRKSARIVLCKTAVDLCKTMKKL